MFKANIRQRTDDGRQVETKAQMAFRPGEITSTKRHTMIYKTLHWQLKIEHHQPIQSFYCFVINIFITKKEYNIHNWAKLIKHITI
jgi:hypothetical protein